jgi:FkbM family methyltransferase
MSFSAGLSRVVPPQWVGGFVRVVYPRVEPELRRVAEYVPAGGTAIDVGGWFGPWTGRLRRRAERVVAVEADPGLVTLLRLTFPDVRVVHGAASDLDGEIELWTPRDRLDGTASVEKRAGRPVKVPRITIDGLRLSDVRFIKLDIEGHELAALRGAEETIKRDRPVLLLELEERHRPVAPTVELLEGWGYAGQVLVGDRWVPLRDFRLVEHQAANLRRVRQSFLRRLLWPRPRYVNTVLFRPLRPRG